jgi:hypothetical protein
VRVYRRVNILELIWLIRMQDDIVVKELHY